MIESKIKSTSKSKSNQQTCLPARQTTNNKQQTIPPLCALLLALCLLIFTSTITATIHYVSHSGSSTPPYTSWETAADSIQKATDICLPGDTVLVANGVYYEALYINKTIHLIGSSMDSTIINNSQSDSAYIVYFFENNSTSENFTFKGPGKHVSGFQGIYLRRANLVIKNCKIMDSFIGFAISSSSPQISNCIVYNTNYGIFSQCIQDNCISHIFNNIIISQNSVAGVIVYNFGGSLTFYNNIIIEEAASHTGVRLESQKRVVFKNNLISGFRNQNVSVTSHSDTVFLVNNNSMNVQVASAFNINQGNKTVLRNNIIQNTNIGVYGFDDVVNTEYNLFNNVNQPVSGSANLGSGSIFADPMFVNDTLPVPNGSYDLHLQAYSPAIDAGDPSILDVDGTRSDIGMYGGPLGESYKYKDLAPKPPRNLYAIIDSNQILVKWNRNTEADTSYYNIYRDTVANFTIDSTKLVSSQTDTFYIQYPPYQSSRYVYKITCVDKQGYESLPSEELVINITSLTTNDYPVTINDYLLYQNYPNPFNPSTTIAYKLKERAYVKLMVYDIKGELISVLVNKEQESGYYEVEFNVGNGLPSVPNSLASGIYLYRIEVIGEGRIPVYSDMKKMLLIK